MILLTIWLRAFEPAGSASCLIRAATGVACPGCGMTRAVAALLHGDLSNMWELHPLAPVVVIEVLVVWATWGWIVFVRRRAFDEVLLLWMLGINLGLLLLVWITRLSLGALPR